MILNLSRKVYMKFELPKLPYNFNALEPFIDAQTMEIHLTKHHAAYVNNLNAALEKFPELSEKGLEELLTNLQTLPEEIRNAVKNNGGGHYNHTQYWNILGPNGGGEPSGQMADDIKNNLGIKGIRIETPRRKKMRETSLNFIRRVS